MAKLKDQITKRVVIRSEYAEQVAIFTWAKLFEDRCPALALLNGSLNGVRVNIGQAVKMRAAGMKKGYPDIFWPYPRNNYHGLYIELKRRKRGSVSVEQDWWLKKLAALDYACFVCKGSDAAISVIRKYGDIRE